MSSTTSPNDAQQLASEPSVIETMLERPVRQVVRFVCQALGTWLRGLLDPWRLGQAVEAQHARLAPPFAFLVVMLLLAGVTLRLWRSIASVPMDSETLMEDLRLAMGDVSLAQTLLMTFPCVLVVAGGARLISLLFRGPRRFEEDQLVVAVCYAIGWLAGVVACICAMFSFLQASGYNPVHTFNRVLHEHGYQAAAVVIFWGGLIAAPTLRARLPHARWWPLPVALASSVACVGSMLFGSMSVLLATADISSAAQRQRSRMVDAQIGDLDIDVLRITPLGDNSEVAPERFQLTLAYSSHAKEVLVVPQQDELKPTEQAIKNLGDCRLRVIASSLDDLPDRALIIQPGQTRVAEYTLEVTKNEGKSRASGRAFTMAYHRRQHKGGFEAGRVTFWATGVVRR